MEIKIEQSDEATFNLKDQIANILEAKKQFAFSAVEELVSDIKKEYEGVLSQRESELRLSKNQEMEFSREIEHLINRKNEILHSLEIETQSHKKTIANLISKDKEIGELIRNNEEIREKQKEEIAKNEALSDELAKRSLLIIELKEELDRLRSENETLKDKADRLKSYTQKGSMAYANAQHMAENEIMTKTIAKGVLKTEQIAEVDSKEETGGEAPAS